MTDTSTATTETASTDAPHGTEGEQTTETPTVEDLLAKVEELTGHSRKWEDRAKANKEAADELAALKRERMTDDEKAQAAVAEIEQRAKDAEDRAEKAEAALARMTVATEFGLTKEDADALAAVSDPEALRLLAERLASRSTGPRPNPAQGNREGAPQTPKDAAIDALGSLFD